MTNDSKISRTLAWSIAGVIIITAMTAMGFSIRHAITSGINGGSLTHQAHTPIIAVGFALVGALVAGRQPKNVIGWIFLTVGLLSMLQASAAAITNQVEIEAFVQQNVVVKLATWLGIWIWMPVTFIPTMLVFLLFPNGRLPSSRWRMIHWSAILGIALSVLVMAFHPGPLESWDLSAGNPYGIHSMAGMLEIIGIIAQILLAIGLVGSIAAFVTRFRRSQEIERKQMTWLLYAQALVITSLVASSILWYIQPEGSWLVELGFALLSLTVLGIAIAAGIAILRYRLYDIDLVINRTLVYGALTLCIVVLYAIIVGGLSTFFQAQGNPLVALLATGSVAVIFQPLRDRLQLGANRLYYGRRDDPLEALSQLGRRLETSIDPEVLLPTLVETIAQTLRLPYVAISLKTGELFQVVAQTGQPVAGAINLPLIYQGETLGQLIAGPRGPGESFNPADKRLLENISHQAGPAVHAIQLTTALQHSRLQLVTAREEERRRLRRDLHDGLGATLAALNLEAGAIKRSIRSHPDKAEALVDELRGDIRATIDDIRQLVYALRPPALDQLGLVASVQAQAVQSSRPDPDNPDGLRIRVEVEAPEELPQLPAAVEVAAYRITQEALTNVIHHAQAKHCLVRLEMKEGPMLSVEIVDDGLGIPPDRAKNGGVGLLSMRERATELGGTCQIGPVPGGGSRVIARLPLGQPSQAGGSTQ